MELSLQRCVSLDFSEPIILYLGTHVMLSLQHSAKAMITGLKLGVSFKSLCFLMMPIFKRGKKHTVIGLHSRQPGDLRAPELTQILPRPRTRNTAGWQFMYCLVMIPIPSLFNHSQTAAVTLHLFRDKEKCPVWLSARWPSAADGACPDTAFIPSRDLPAFQYAQQPGGMKSAS